MANEILDEIEKEIPIPKLALKAYDQFWYSIIVYTGIFIAIYIIDYFGFKRIPFEVFYIAAVLIGTIGFIFNFLGMMNGYKSRREKEPYTWKILVGSFGNMGLFLLWILFLLVFRLVASQTFRF